jgi:hypothetical protein
MAEIATFTIEIEPDAGRSRRFRWKILEDGKARDKSVYSFATKREAQIDAEKFVGKLNSTWRISSGS